MKSKPKAAATATEPVPTSKTRPVHPLRQRWHEAWDAMPLGKQLRITILAAVALVVVVAQLAVTTYEIAANHFQSRTQVAAVSAAILGYEDELGNRDILAGVQAQPSVILATLEQPAGEVLWTFDRNAQESALQAALDHGQLSMTAHEGAGVGATSDIAPPDIGTIGRSRIVKPTKLLATPTLNLGAQRRSC